MARLDEMPEPMRSHLATLPCPAVAWRSFQLPDSIVEAIGPSR